MAADKLKEGLVHLVGEDKLASIFTECSETEYGLTILGLVILTVSFTLYGHTLGLGRIVHYAGLLILTIKPFSSRGPTHWPSLKKSWRIQTALAKLATIRMAYQFGISNQDCGTASNVYMRWTIGRSERSPFLVTRERSGTGV